MSNNLFSFATSELSQDAFICWAINWFNDDSNPELNQMSKDILSNFTSEEIKSVYVTRQFSRVVYEDGIKDKTRKLEVKIDILVVINENISVVIEDKTFTSEHDDQINRYVRGIRELLKQNDCAVYINDKVFSLDPSKIITVFWKTGFFYDYDKVIDADVIINYNKVMEIMEPYRKESDILSDYLDKIREDNKWYDDHKKYWLPANANSHWDKNIARHQIAQYTLMREFFPEERWVKKIGEYYEPYQIYHGSSYGRPWTEMKTCQGYYKNGDFYEVFWRIDSDNEGPYISLRLYEVDYSKEKAARHKEMYNMMKTVMTSIINTTIPEDSKEDPFKKAVEINKGGRNEASFFHLHLNFDTWDKEKVIKLVDDINDKFVSEFENSINRSI